MSRQSATCGRGIITLRCAWCANLEQERYSLLCVMRYAVRYWIYVFLENVSDYAATQAFGTEGHMAHTTKNLFSPSAMSASSGSIVPSSIASTIRTTGWSYIVVRRLHELSLVGNGSGHTSIGSSLSLYATWLSASLSICLFA